MGLSKPFGFMAGAADGAPWDPSLGGTYSVEHHWDFTDTETMTFGGTGVSGSEVATITDKVGSITMQPVNGPSGNATQIITTGSFSTAHNATYLSGSPYQNYNGGTYNWLPTNAVRHNNDWTVLCLAGNEDWTRYFTNTPRALWYARSNDSNGWNNLLSFMMYDQAWIAQTCSGSGNWRYGVGVYDGSWGTSAQKPMMMKFGSAPESMDNPGAYFMAHDKVSDDGERYDIQLNDNPECFLVRPTNVTGAGEGLTIGGGPIGLDEKNSFEGMMYHFVVYDEYLDKTARDAVYDSWYAHFN